MYVVPDASQFLAVEEYRHGNDEGEQGEAVPDEIDRGRDDFRSALDRRLMNVAAKAVIRVVAPDSIVRAPPTRVLCAVVPDPVEFLEARQRGQRPRRRPRPAQQGVPVDLASRPPLLLGQLQPLHFFLMLQLEALQSRGIERLVQLIDIIQRVDHVIIRCLEDRLVARLPGHVRLSRSVSSRVNTTPLRRSSFTFAGNTPGGGGEGGGGKSRKNQNTTILAFSFAVNRLISAFC